MRSSGSALSIAHGGRVLFFQGPGPASASAPLPDTAIAVCPGPTSAAVLCAEGDILILSPDGSAHRVRRVDLPEGTALAAVSADGSRVVVSARAGGKDTGVCREEEGQWAWLSEPDFLCAITSVRCAPDGKTFGYAYRTSQPWSEDGSYGSRMYGAVVFAADGRALREDWDTRAHDEEPNISLAWGADGEPLVLLFNDAARGCGEVIASWGQAQSEPARPWDTGPLGSNALASEERLVVTSSAGVAVSISPDGRVVGALDADGNVWVLDGPGRRRCRAAERAIAIELGAAPLIGWVSAEGVWTQKPLSAFEWEAVTE